MLNIYLKCCQKCIENKNNDSFKPECKFPEYCDIHLSNGSVFADTVHEECRFPDTAEVEGIEMTFHDNEWNEERKRYITRLGDIVAIVERHND